MNRFKGFVTASSFVFRSIVCLLVLLSVVLAIAPLPKPHSSDHNLHNKRGPLPRSGPHVPIPTVNAVTSESGRLLYQREGCSECHILAGADPKDDRIHNPGDMRRYDTPVLTHEGRRNASIDWQIENLTEHSRMYPYPSMPDYNNLSPTELRVLASYLASRR